MSAKLNKIISILKKLFQLLLIFVCGYFIILILAILWTFEVKLHRWPVFIYSAPFSFQVGDDINRIRLFERLGRQGYLESVVPVPEPGEWSRSGSGITIFLKSSPFAEENCQWSCKPHFGLGSHHLNTPHAISTRSESNYSGTRANIRNLSLRFQPGIVSSGFVRRDPPHVGRRYSSY